MSKKACCTKEGLNRGAWTSQEDKLLSDYIMTHGLGRWRTLPANAGLNRCGKSCRLRWLNYLRPDIKRGNITEEEEELIIRLHKLLGNRWSLIAGRLPGRTDNEIKNYWNTYLQKKVSSDVTGPYVSSKYKKVLCSKLSMEKKQGSGISQVNVIRTKAIRCTRPLFFDPNHTSQFESSASAQTPAAPIAAEFLPSFKEHEGEDPFPSHMEPNRLCMKQFMQCSAFLQESQDGSHTSNSVHECDNDNGIITPIDEDNYVDEMYYGMIDEEEGLSSLLNMDS